jgi:rubrerythrin
MQKKWICTVCGYVHEGPTPPEQCPQCKVPASKFKELEENEGLQFETVHEIGVAKGLGEEMIKDLNAHFNGECTEVGMYLAMSRQADREGYPEVAEAFKRYAWEEAEHAAKFAELLGDVVWIRRPTSKSVWQLNQALALTSSALPRTLRLRTSTLSTTVHEMAKDEARHGKGFEGLYNRYFKK